MQTKESKQTLPSKQETDFLAYVSYSMTIVVWWVAVFTSKAEEPSIEKYLQWAHLKVCYISKHIIYSRLQAKN